MLKKAVLLIFVGTLFSLLYVHQQIALYKISYCIKNFEQTVDVLVDQNEYLQYNVASLKSPHALEEVMVAKNIQLHHPDSYQLVTYNDVPKRIVKKKRRQSNQLLVAINKMFSLKRLAIAEEKSQQ